MVKCGHSDAVDSPPETGFSRRFRGGRMTESRPALGGVVTRFCLPGKRIGVLLGVLLCCGAAAGLDPYKDFDHYTLDSWSVDEGLPQITVLAIVQSRSGYIWVGTYEGLARFDGVQFTVFDKDNTPAFKNNNVLALLEDRRGRLWVGTPNGLLLYEGDAGATSPRPRASPATSSSPCAKTPPAGSGSARPTA